MRGPGRCRPTLEALRPLLPYQLSLDNASLFPRALHEAHHSSYIYPPSFGHSNTSGEPIYLYTYHFTYCNLASRCHSACTELCIIYLFNQLLSPALLITITIPSLCPEMAADIPDRNTHQVVGTWAQPRIIEDRPPASELPPFGRK